MICDHQTIILVPHQVLIWIEEGLLEPNVHVFILLELKDVDRDGSFFLLVWLIIYVFEVKDCVKLVLSNEV